LLQKGERVFFADNSEGDQAHCELFARTARALGLETVFHAGAGAAVRHSSLDREIRNDFYAARAVVLYFGAPKEGSNHEDHWVLPEIRHVANTGVPCLVYVSENFPKAILANHGYQSEPNVTTEADFSAILQRDLASLINS
jgi:hypothetical protein